VQDYYDESSVKRRADTLARMRREKERQLLIRKRLRIIIPVAAVIILIIAVIVGILIVKGGAKSRKETEISSSENIELEKENNEPGSISLETEVSKEEQEEAIKALTRNNNETVVYSASTTDKTNSPSEEVVSERAIVVDTESDEIIVQRGYKDRIVPASMTKILTVLTAADYITDLDDKFTMTLDITDYGYVHDCSGVGFEDGETVTVRDMLYGTILPSGADAAVGLATYVAGSHEAFVDLMNKKIEELGLAETSHFTNCVGVYDENLYTTVYDMAMIMEAAMNNELCKEVMSAHTYTTSSTEQHPEGITVSNWFLRRIEDKDTGGEVLCAKTGYVVQSKNCAASFQEYDDGRKYVCVTAGSTSAWRCIYDHVELYNQCK